MSGPPPSHFQPPPQQGFGNLSFAPPRPQQQQPPPMMNTFAPSPGFAPPQGFAAPVRFQPPTQAGVPSPGSMMAPPLAGAGMGAPPLGAPPGGAGAVRPPGPQGGFAPPPQQPIMRPPPTSGGSPPPPAGTAMGPPPQANIMNRPPPTQPQGMGMGMRMGMGMPPGQFQPPLPSGPTFQPNPAAPGPMGQNPAMAVTNQMAAMSMAPPQAQQPTFMAAPASASAPPTSKPRRVYAETLQQPTSPSQQSAPVAQQHQPMPSQSYGQPPMMGQPQTGFQQLQPTMPPQGFVSPSQIGRAPQMPQQQPQMQPQMHPQMQPISSSQPPEPPKRVVGKSKIDPNSIPSPVSFRASDQQAFATQPFRTCSKEMPPLVTTECPAFDEGNSTPNYIRMTSYNVPCTNDIVKTSDIPLGFIVQPFAEPKDGSYIPVVDFGDKGIVRCQRCKAYINPFMMFVDGGKNFVCNLCGMKNAVPDFYFSNLDMRGKRLDIGQRPELCLGTIEFNAPADYSQRPANPAGYVFVVDVSIQAKQSGLINICAEAIREAIKEIPRPVGAETTPIDIAIMTFDRTIHFYNLSPALSQPQMLVVSELDDPFVPLETGFLVNPDYSKDVIEALLTQIPVTFKDTVVSENALGAAIRAAHLGLKNRGGKVFVFQSGLPNAGPGVLRPREDVNAIGTEKEKALFLPQDPFYAKLGQECVESGVAVDIFVAAPGYADIASVGALASLTGGSTFYFPRFNPVKNGEALTQELLRDVKKVFGFEGLMRVRTSAGLRVADHFGNFFSKNDTDLNISGVDSETAVGVHIQHEGPLDDKSDAAFQCAILYTTMFGLRRIRVINLSVPTCSNILGVFKFAEIDAIMTLLAKMGLHQVSSSSLSKIRNDISKKVTNILLSYRKNCSSSSSLGQLVLPESLKLLPALTSALLKNPALKGGANISLDERVYTMRLLKGAGVFSSIPIMYPRMLALHELPANLGQVDEAGILVRPTYVRMSYERLNPQGVYLVENGRKLFLWVGANVSSKLVQDLFGTGFIESIDPTLTSLPPLSSPFSKQVRTLIDDIRAKFPLRFLPLEIVRQREPIEVAFNDTVMVEDKIMMEPSYVDFLCNIHRDILNEISPD